MQLLCQQPLPPTAPERVTSKTVAFGEPFGFSRNDVTRQLTSAARIEGSRALCFKLLFRNELRRFARRPGALRFERVLFGVRKQPYRFAIAPRIFALELSDSLVNRLGELTAPGGVARLWHDVWFAARNGVSIAPKGGIIGLTGRNAASLGKREGGLLGGDYNPNSRGGDD